MTRLLAIAIAFCCMACPACWASESVRVLATTERPIPGGGLTPVSWRESHLTPDGGAWAMVESPIESCGLINCQFVPVHLLQLDAGGAAIASVEVGRRNTSPFSPGPVLQLATDRQSGDAVYTSGAPDTPAGLWTLPAGQDTPTLLATTDEQLFVDNQFAREIGIGKPGEAYYSGRFQLSQAVTADQDTAIWRTRDGATEVIAREGSPAPGVPGALLGPIGHHTPLIIIGSNPTVAPFASSRGGVAFWAEIKIPGFEFVQERGLWADRGNGTQLVTRTSLPAPGTEAGNVFAPETGFSILTSSRAFSDPQITDNGDVVFAANLRSGISGWDGLWRSPASGGLHALMTVHDAVAAAARPDDREATFRRIGEFSAANSGHVAFTGAMQMETIVQDEFGNEYSEYEDQDGVWLYSPGAGLELVDLTQNEPPHEVTSTYESGFRVNDAGQVAFTRFSYGDVDNHQALAALGRGGGLVEILQTGDTVDIGQDATPDLRTISSFSLQDFDNAGRVLIQAWFEEGGSALIVSDAVTAPAAAGDYNGDGLVDAADYQTWRSTYGAQVRVGDGADGNLNGVIDAGDFTHWRDLYAPAQFNAAPEPGVVVQLGIAAALAVWGRSRRAAG
ncbi:hypothetical protein KOR34_27220 [Posidoniimonas corsicana]|uniref:Uncharacterized protein n=1 Tax=Posidoniimonas corsicana TaxID=1938618 RepID=A0A5C5VIP8_9BACT|nr:choice-of-anchor tandem repeat NxxGxxAF-containing protein [Posidoniimonas corsicana]TWT37759.1 hypothetical protein KOR34_27220 [Posidoniimonas corsicana]